jgi:peptidyl-prolyl cis-trans isomerase SurA
MTILGRFPHIYLALILIMAVPAVAAGEPSAESTNLPREVLVDSVIAAVDDKPIMLSELGSRLIPPRKLSLGEASKDQTVMTALDALIMEKLVEAEAQQKRVSASEAEVTDYIEEVARRNGLTQAAFQEALASRGQSLDSYKQQVKTDILKTKLASSIARGGTSVSESEIDEYLGAHSELRSDTASLTLRQILVSAEGRSADEMSQRVTEITAALESGESFAEVAQRLSDGPHAAEGGMLGTIAEKDLSSEILEAVGSVDVGSFSKPISGPQGTQLFLVEKRFSSGPAGQESDGSDTDARREEARRILQQQKAQARLSSYFVGELYKNHSVDKKL